MRPVCCRFLAAALVAACCGLAAPDVSADITTGPRPGGKKKEKPAPRAPVAKDLTVRAVRGRPLEITLEGITGTGSGLDFSIRTQPRIGLLQPPTPRPLSGLRAVVTYTAPPDSSGDRDTFTYGVQLPGRPSSTSATVTILISDPRAKLETVTGIDAGVVVMGQPVEKSLTIRNSGDGPWEESPALPAGWEWRSPAGGAFSLPPGASMEAVVACTGSAPGILDETVVLGGTAKVRLAARVIAPFTTFPSTLVLDWLPDALVRRGTLQLQNNTKSPLALRLTVPAGFRFPDKLTLPADGRVSVPVEATVAPDLAQPGTVEIEGNGHRQAVRLEARRAPAHARLAPGSPQSLDFGTVPAGSAEAVRTLTIENAGGESCPVSAEPPDGFVVRGLGEGSSATLKPGIPLTLQVLTAPGDPGPRAGTLTLVAGLARIAVPLKAEVAAAPAAPDPGAAADRTLQATARPPAPDNRPRTPEQLLTIAGHNAGGVLQGDGTESPLVPVVEVVDYIEDDGKSVTFAWDLPEGNGWNFRLLRPTVRRSKTTGALARVWQPCGPEATIRIEGRRAIATMTGLEPGRPFNCRIQTISSEGRKSLPSREFGFIPMLKEPLPWLRWIMGTLAIIAVSLWGWKKWKEPIRVQAA